MSFKIILSSTIQLGVRLLGLSMICSCAASVVPKNGFEESEVSSAYMAEWRSDYRARRLPFGWAGVENTHGCKVQGLPEAVAALPFGRNHNQLGDPRLAPGDLLQLNVEDDTLFSGPVVVASDGTISLRHMAPIGVAGRSIASAEDAVENALVGERIYKQGYSSVSLTVGAWAPVDVVVDGAVFIPGPVTVNDLPAEALQSDKVEASGDHAIQRRLSAALRAAGGIRPDADLSGIVIMREGQERKVDLSDALAGNGRHDPFLMSGDRVVVPSRGCFDAGLAQPSPITPPGVRVFLSNLSSPARANGPSAIGQHSTSLPYGTTLLQALFSANCVGGTQVTNAGRFAILATTDPITGESVVIQRAVEDLVRRPDRAEFNPTLLPGDAIACYNSVATNVRDVLAMIGELAGPSLLTVGLLEAAE
ncbi:polysaccharide biosynthesis/export family protein [Parvularcula maris]|uniref:Polysaccharide biosynthesis/export family protein n=1 Tax=Parvularcula maris TaxID=2965077 RepID=A0A9X2L6P3_9PROT|nr:polysaccharide biosynthesis/export family protein [Parvularcula maris]MCQ8183956.1 polysaccharide biosynthesis/export family protein [Parvularcula maris]